MHSGLGFRGPGCRVLLGLRLRAHRAFGLRTRALACLRLLGFSKGFFCWARTPEVVPLKVPLLILPWTP